MYEKAIEQIKNNSISKIISKYVKLQNSGARKMKGLCPFHKEKTPSLAIDDSKNLFHCFGCGAGGDTISFVQQIKSCSFQEAIETICGFLSIEIEKKEQKIQNNNIENSYQIYRLASEFFHKNLFENSNKNVLDYLITIRNLSLKIIKEFQIGYCPNNTIKILDFFKNYNISNNGLIKIGILTKNNKLFFENRIIIPIKNSSGKIIAFSGRSVEENHNPKYINSIESEIFSKSSILFNLHEARQNISKDLHLIIVEGHMDVIKLHANGFKNSVASMGTSITEEHLKQIFQIEKQPIFCFDSDIAGKNAMMRAAIMLLKYLKPSIVPKFLILKNAKDVDEFLEKFNKKDLKNEIEKSIEIQDFIFKNLIAKYDLKNPNQKSMLQEEINEICLKIEDKIIQNNYKKYWNNRFYELFSYKKVEKIVDLDLKSESLDLKEKKIIFFILKNQEFIENNDFLENIFVKFGKKNQEVCIQIINKNIEENLSKLILEKYKFDYSNSKDFAFNSLIIDWEISYLESMKNKLDSIIFQKERKTILEKKKKLLNYNS